MTDKSPIADSIEQTWIEEDMLRKEWALGDYVSEDCPNCGRKRLCKCPNGKHRCEKCNWVPEINDWMVIDQ